MIAVSGLDMAAWDALAEAASMPLCVLLGGSIGAVKAYNSNGLWLKDPDAVAAEAIGAALCLGFSLGSGFPAAARISIDDWDMAKRSALLLDLGCIVGAVHQVGEG